MTNQRNNEEEPDAYMGGNQQEQTATTAQNTQTEQQSTPTPSGNNGYQEWIEALGKQKEQSDADRKKIDALDPESPENQRRQKRNRLIASIGDGLSSIAKMYFAAKGAPVAQSDTPTLSASVANQKLNDTNRYYALLSKWRADRNDLIKAQADMQYKQNNLQYQNDRLNFERDREARLKAKQDLDDAYRKKLLRLKEKGLGQGEEKQKLDKWYKQEQLKIANYNATTKRIAANKAPTGETETVTEEPLIDPREGTFITDDNTKKPIIKIIKRTTKRK